MAVKFDDEQRAFLDEVQPALVGTIRSNGTVQINPAWYERRDNEIWLNPAASRAWGKRLTSGADVTLLVISPSNMWRWIQILGTVIEKTAEGAEEHIDRLSRRYLGADYSFHNPSDARRIVRVEPKRAIGQMARKGFFRQRAATAAAEHGSPSE